MITERLNNFKNKVIIVTGGTVGIGKSIAESYLEENGKLAIIARNELRLTQVLGEFKTNYHQTECKGYICDVRNQSEVERTIENIISDFGEINILINNAGANSRVKVDKYTISHWEEEIGTNLTGSFNCSMAAFKYMRKLDRSWIVNISSIKGKEATSSVGYGAAKAGVIGLTKSLAKQFILSGVYVNCVALGFINTGMTKLLSKEEFSEYLKHIPIGRMGETSEVASVIKFLSSPSSSYIVGATIDVNGGYLM